ncbi:hypothetical protein ACO1C4_22610 [Bacillus cereus]|uniref:hypothetical protein n=1 Tax=Bacillus cereus TaxID=1396 RepID=UPI003BF665BD
MQLYYKLYTTAMGFLFAAVIKNKQYINTNYRSLRDKFQWCITRYGHRSKKVTGHVSAGDDVRKALIAIAVASGIVFVFAMIYLRKMKLAEVNDLNLNIK